MAPASTLGRFDFTPTLWHHGGMNTRTVVTAWLLTLAGLWLLQMIAR